MKQGGAALEKHNVEQKLKGFLSGATVSSDSDWWRKALNYMKTLSPSGVELEIMGLASFDFSADMQSNSNFYIAQFLTVILECVRTRNEADFCQALLNCCLKINYEAIVQDDALVGQIKAIQKAGKRNFEEFEDLLGHNLCMISHFTGF